MPSQAHLGTLFQINVNPKGGVPKHAIPVTFVHHDHVSGDKQYHRRFHGGPERAVCLFSLERIQALQAEGHPIEPGSTGENLTISGLDWEQITPGVCLQIGEQLELEISSYARPCEQISDSFRMGKSARISHLQYPGWSRVYARVLREGQVETGDQVMIRMKDEG